MIDHMPIRTHSCALPIEYTSVLNFCMVIHSIVHFHMHPLSVFTSFIYPISLSISYRTPQVTRDYMQAVDVALRSGGHAPLTCNEATIIQKNGIIAEVAKWWGNGRCILSYELCSLVDVCSPTQTDEWRSSGR